LNQRETTKKPLVLLPEGPYGWSSHQYIVPELVKLWSSIGFDVLKIWYPDHKWQYDELEKIANASVLVFPLGYSHYRGLQTLDILRSGYNIQTPACLMYTSDINTGLRYLATAENILKNSDCLMVNSSAEANLIKTFFPQLKLKIFVSPLPVNEEIFNLPELKNKTQLRRRLGLSLQAKIIIYAGRISEQKNIVSLLAVFRELKKSEPLAKLLILGDADEVGVPHFKKKTSRRYIVKISQAISLLNISADVEFRPAVSQTELANYFKACDVHVSLTTHSGEDFGYSIAQGLACGIPTVVTKWGGGVDLSRACYGVNVTASAAGPVVDHPAAIRLLKLALSGTHTKNKKFIQSFSRQKAASTWSLMARSYSSPKRRFNNRKQSVLGRYTLPQKKYFINGDDRNFRKYALAYSQQMPKQQSKYHINPVFSVRLREHPEKWEKELAQLNEKDRNVLVNFIESYQPHMYFRKISGLSKAGQKLLVESGMLCPSAG
jgi:glycosyltransferase involved in cell wall biosynthesis